MNYLDDDFLRKYFSINEKICALNHSTESFSGFFNLKTSNVKWLIERGEYTIEFFIKALIFSLIQKVIFRFLPENHIYLYNWGFGRYQSLLGSNNQFIYRHKFLNGSDILIQNLSKRYGSKHDYASKIEREIDKYVDFTIMTLIGELDPVCITSLKDNFSWIINHEEFKSEFSADPLSFSYKFYTRLKSKL
jgi:hypothetical protein